MKAQTLTRVLFGRGSTRMNVLVDADPRLRVGVLVRLDGEEGFWQVLELHETIDRRKIKYGWNNNI